MFTERKVRKENEEPPFSIGCLAIFIAAISVMSFGIWTCYLNATRPPEERKEYHSSDLFNRLDNVLHETTIPAGGYFEYHCSSPLYNREDGIALVINSDVPVRTGIEITTNTGRILYDGEGRYHRFSDSIEDVFLNTNDYRAESLGIRIYNEDSIPITIETNAAIVSRTYIAGKDCNGDQYSDPAHYHQIVMEASCIADDIAAMEGSE